jgi:hypothetical protein
MLLVCIGFFVHGLQDWARVLMFIAIVGVAAWGNGAQTQVSVRESAPQPRMDDSGALNEDLPVQQKVAD